MTNLREQAADAPPASYRTIALTQGQEAIIDAADFAWLSQWKWQALWMKCTQSFYAIRTERREGRRHAVLMHRQILDAHRGIRGDHKDGNTLNNRRENLRFATVAQNACNQKLRSDSASGFKGVRRYGRAKRWQAYIKGSGRWMSLGYFDSAQEAARAYDAAAHQYHGEFARVNFP